MALKSMSIDLLNTDGAFIMSMDFFSCLIRRRINPSSIAFSLSQWVVNSSLHAAWRCSLVQDFTYRSPLPVRLRAGAEGLQRRL